MSDDKGLETLEWKRTTVDDRPAAYGEAGSGDLVVFLHGWAIVQHAYAAALERLVRNGMHVIAPALPGFGNTASLPDHLMSFAGYAAWLDHFLDAIDVHEPAFVIGHSFGGGVAIATAYAHPERVNRLVLVNSVGGTAWTSSNGRLRSMAERPLWDWGLHFPADVMPGRQLRRVVPVVLADAIPNMLRNPNTLLRTAKVARNANLTAELEELKHRGLPVVVLWGDKDRIIPRASFEALCSALGHDGTVVDGAHSWMLAEPDAFAEVITNAVGVAELARRMEDPATASAEPEERELPDLGPKKRRHKGTQDKQDRNQPD